MALRAPGVCDVLGALLLSGIGGAIGVSVILSHLRHYQKPHLQRQIVRILIITPLYSAFSSLSLVLPSQYVLFDSIRDIWEAVVIYCFLALVVDYAGGEARCVEAMQVCPGTLKHVFPLNLIPHSKILPREIPLNPTFLKWCRRAALQFVVVKPVMAVLTFSLWVSQSSLWSTWHIIEAVVYNLSYSIALYALVLFYLATKCNPDVLAARPLPKFLAVKLIVFATYWQSIIIILCCPHLDNKSVRRWNSFVLCLETPIAGLLQAWAFPASEFDPEASDLRSLFMQRCLDVLWREPAAPEVSANVATIEVDVSGSGSTSATASASRRKQILDNAKDVLGVHDVMEDALYSFKPRYAQHARLGRSDSEIEIEIDHQEDEEYYFNNP